MVAVSLKKKKKNVFFFFLFFFLFFFFKQKTAYEISLGLVGSEMCIRDSEIVVPSKTDPNKFDVYSDYIYLPYYFRFYGRLLSFNEDDGNKMISIGGEMLIEHTNMLRDKNKHLMPFRIVAHNVERPLSDEHKMTGPDYKSELDHIADKFKG